jgi:hypothetical protein
VRGDGLETKLRRAGRLLPRWVRRDAALLVQAERVAGHPKLRMQIDASGLDAAYRHCDGWLRGVDPNERRKDRVLGLLAVNAFNLLLLTTGFIVWMVWSGHL